MTISKPINIILIAIYYFLIAIVVLTSVLFFLMQSNDIKVQSFGLRTIFNPNNFINTLAIFLQILIPLVIGIGIYMVKNWARLSAISYNIMFIFVILITVVLYNSLFRESFLLMLVPFLLIAINSLIIIQLLMPAMAISFSKSDSGSNRSLRRQKVEKEQYEYYLEAFEGLNIGEKHYLNYGNNIIGRESGCNIHLEDSERFVSRKHTVINISDGRIRIKNISRVNKTFVNDITCEMENLEINDTISIGKYKFQLCQNELLEE